MVELEKRVNDLEKKWLVISVAGGIIAACTVAFLGFTYLDTPKRIQEALKTSSLHEAEIQAQNAATNANNSASTAAQDARRISDLKTEAQKTASELKAMMPPAMKFLDTRDQYCFLDHPTADPKIPNMPPTGATVDCIDKVPSQASGAIIAVQLVGHDKPFSDFTSTESA
jgi:hypothetical protein